MLRQLTGAPRSRSQLEAALARRGVSEDVAGRVLDRFVEVGLIDDAEYARLVVRSQQESKGLARRGLAAELRRRGVGDEHAEAALAEVDTDQEVETARRLLERKWRSTATLEPEVRARRAAAMLARKGYPSGIVTRLVREAMTAETSAAWDPEPSD